VPGEEIKKLDIALGRGGYDKRISKDMVHQAASATIVIE
jgi:hypothetical protein